MKRRSEAPGVPCISGQAIAKQWIFQGFEYAEATPEPA
jgi:hypothetical protein